MKRKTKGNIVLTFQQDLKFLETFNSFEKSNFEPTQERQTMAELYINSMASGLMAFHKNEMKKDYQAYINIFGQVSNWDFYTALAWQGLSNNGVRAWNVLSESDKKRITDMQARTGILLKKCD